MADRVEPPSLAEIHHIVQRRRRSRYRATQGAVGLAVVVAVGYGLTRPQDTPIISEPSGSGIVPTPPAATPSLTDPRRLPSVVDPEPDVDLLAPTAPAWLEAAANDYAARWALDAEGFDSAAAIAADWGIDVAETKAVLGVADSLGRQLAAGSNAALIDAFLDRGGSFDEAAAIAADWGVNPTVVKLLAALDVAEVPLELD